MQKTQNAMGTNILFQFGKVQWPYTFYFTIQKEILLSSWLVWASFGRLKFQVNIQNRCIRLSVNLVNQVEFLDKYIEMLPVL